MRAFRTDETGGCFICPIQIKETGHRGVQLRFTFPE